MKIVSVFKQFLDHNIFSKSVLNRLRACAIDKSCYAQTLLKKVLAKEMEYQEDYHQDLFSVELVLDRDEPKDLYFPIFDNNKIEEQRDEDDTRSKEDLGIQSSEEVSVISKDQQWLCDGLSRRRSSDQFFGNCFPMPFDQDQNGAIKPIEIDCLEEEGSQDFGLFQEMKENDNEKQTPFEEYEKQQEKETKDKTKTKRITQNANEAKNVPKNVCKAVIKFVSKNQEEVQRLLIEIDSPVPYRTLNSNLQKVKSNASSIKKVKNLWLNFAFARELRVIQEYFMRKRYHHWVFNSKVMNKMDPLKFLPSLRKGIRNPQQFDHLK